MKKGVELRVIWNDNDMIELEVSGSNGLFSGKTLTYDDPDAPGSAAKLLEGFPANREDVREIQFGFTLPPAQQGACCLGFRCRDAACHLLVEVEIKSDIGDIAGQSVTFFLPVEAAAIDNFVEQLRTLQTEPYGGSAFLAAAK
jgi:hypothetical protein